MLCNFPVRHALRDQLQNFLFAPTQGLRGSIGGACCGRCFGRSRKLLHDAFGNEGINRCATAQGAGNAQSQLQIIALLEQITCCAGAQRTQNSVFCAPGRDDQNHHRRIACTQLFNHGVAGTIGQTQIDQSQRNGLMRIDFTCLGHAFCP